MTIEVYKSLVAAVPAQESAFFDTRFSFRGTADDIY